MGHFIGFWSYGVDLGLCADCDRAGNAFGLRFDHLDCFADLPAAFATFPSGHDLVWRAVDYRG